jgi:hypothetical protein
MASTYLLCSYSDGHALLQTRPFLATLFAIIWANILAIFAQMPAEGASTQLHTATLLEVDEKELK